MFEEFSGHYGFESTVPILINSVFYHFSVNGSGEQFGSNSFALV